MPDLTPDTVEGRWQRDERLRTQLENERTSFMSHWRDLSDYLLPRRARFSITDSNKGDRRNLKIIDSTGSLAVRTLRSGMMAGVTSPSRPWFRLTTHEQSLADVYPVKMWLHTVTQRMESVFLRSNLYNSLSMLYGDLGVFATAAMYIEEDFTGDVIRTLALPVGSYAIAVNERGVANVFMREFQMTVRQIVNKFAVEGNQVNWDKISGYIKDLWNRGQRESWIQVVHIIHPNDKFEPSRMGSEFKKFRSVYYERGLSGQNSQTYLIDTDKKKVLRESGYDFFPVLCPRWEVTAEDVYGTSCPGMEALGDVKQLQLGERRIMQAIEKSINPPLTGPSILKQSKVSILPGDITYQDIREGMRGLSPTYTIDPRIQEMEAKQAQVRMRVKETFFSDLFRTLIDDRRSTPPTAAEIHAIQEEKGIGLGPVLEQLNQDLYDPLIDIVFDMMVRQGMIPPPPEELQGQPLKVEYVSIMAQVQKQIGLSSIERVTNYVGAIAAVNPEALDKFDSDKAIESYSERSGIDPDIIRSDDQVAEIRNQRAQAAQAQQMMATIQQGAATAKDLAGADLEKDSALKRLVGSQETA